MARLAGDLLVWSAAHRESDVTLWVFVWSIFVCALSAHSAHKEQLQTKIVPAINVAKRTFSVSVVRTAHIRVTHSAHFPGYFTAHNAQTRSQNQPDRPWWSSEQERHGRTQQSTVMAVEPWRGLQLTHTNWCYVLLVVCVHEGCRDHYIDYYWMTCIVLDSRSVPLLKDTSSTSTMDTTIFLSAR